MLASVQAWGMDDERLRSIWLSDESTLAEIGAALTKQPTKIEVHLPRSLASAAVEAWRRDDDDDLGLEGESCEQRVVRHRAGALALIGAAVEDRGREDGETVVVKLDAWFIGDALNAADDAGLIEP
jgi:hypothetical protein